MAIVVVGEPFYKPDSKVKRKMVEVECGTCGKVWAIRQESIAKTKSCGCDLNVKHGHSRTTKAGLSPTYVTWASMRQRCQYEPNIGYARYGASGVSVCEQWQEFERFLADMGERPRGKTIDRIDNSKGYEPGNCRWASKKEQARNRASNRMIEVNGEIKCLAEWCEQYGVEPKRVCQRLHSGWDAEKALTTPFRAKRKCVNNAKSMWRTYPGSG
jgi:hypothetical protein